MEDMSTTSSDSTPSYCDYFTEKIIVCISAYMYRQYSKSNLNILCSITTQSLYAVPSVFKSLDLPQYATYQLALCTKPNCIGVVI
jgi:hypothetical protein